MPSSFRAAVAPPLVLALGFLGGCGGLDQASASGVSDSDVVSEVASQLAGSGSPAYTATYRLAGGATARVVRSPAPERIAYEFPGGRLISTPAAVTHCAADTCTATDAAGADIALPEGTGLVTDTQVVALLEAAAVDENPEATQRDTTLAGRHATCLALTGVQAAETSSFDVCVTVEGTLASFRAVLDGDEVDVVLSEYTGEAEEGAFQIPSGARLIDRRGR
ncbi:hypothetical protein AMIS_7550 [Actinoplanes missouriensis 431]|uniref:Lipoprotein n=1 Tax=Actinoplanes missouriensis (strain ATCC 14538 / DSM 43046 / CBS 188.64 / JCM 3121 / NBRC 102363 / NCIMB 12654 / NRRL B-3342 / UNCC 431) TaxID=512565 RepID=I0GYY8_ACTM4|nr:hypothetical protein [Actinoplanes missouriensis]BAL85975.1 hypothetical protein AMIS_7550 [Actinoplanes missouriensis 431]